MYSFGEITKIIKGKSYCYNDDSPIAYLLYDSRMVIFAEESLFFALSTGINDGHKYLEQVYQKGVRNFIVHDAQHLKRYESINYIEVPDVLHALQLLSTYHRSRFQIPIIGITGSNGKTIVKEWLYQLLEPKFSVIRSPRSYNSQIGVPLSLWQITDKHNLAIFEAGISKAGEMINLEKIIKPTIGILTNIGDAHDNGFENVREKWKEKLLLFTGCAVLIANGDTPLLFELIDNKVSLLTWGKINTNADIYIQEEIIEAQTSVVTLRYQQQEQKLEIPFSNKQSIENCIVCIALLLYLKLPWSYIQEHIMQLTEVDMRLQLQVAVNNCTIINDTYNSDTVSFSMALDYLQQQAKQNSKTVILSDFTNINTHEVNFYARIAEELEHRKIDRFIGIGSTLCEQKSLFNKFTIPSSFYHTTDEFLTKTTTANFNKEFILLKGSRPFTFEKISHWLEKRKQDTYLEINLSALVENLRVFRTLLKPNTKLMAMVKASGYGSGDAEIAHILEHHCVDYLAVAYPDEGVTLRTANISLPIVVLNVAPTDFDTLINFNLTPAVHTISLLKKLHIYLKKEGVDKFPIHLKVNTGMNRMGLSYLDIEESVSLLTPGNPCVLQSVYSHLASSEDPHADNFTALQILEFKRITTKLSSVLPYPFLKHINNTAAVIRHPESVFDMVRLGIGLYGVNMVADAPPIALENVCCLYATIAQIRWIDRGETVGYNQTFTATKTMKTAIVRIGYADGYFRCLGNERARVFLKGFLCPIIGNISMDSLVIDITQVPAVEEDDQVELFGNNLSIKQVATWAGTIPYEIMTHIHQRVKRIYTWT
ncbi:MAG: bifunctional UDP-N-acetylmuramoyl-tripeptide:D-alanyl-D-alanine ligase/alanine racemase [Phycisphaerales bacterium]|nr:bifunctional UDP-N-acetylmuramoyl-tripeptide:D-alanyl-D-alanine ligase/alanine racemase [Phycisphaerales bacterium]